MAESLVAQEELDRCNVERELKNAFPDDGDICNLCGGVIKYVGNVSYEQFFKCTGCGEEWWYD